MQGQWQWGQHARWFRRCHEESQEAAAAAATRPRTTHLQACFCGGPVHLHQTHCGPDTNGVLVSFEAAASSGAISKQTKQDLDAQDDPSHAHKVTPRKRVAKMGPHTPRYRVPVHAAYEHDTFRSPFFLILRDSSLPSSSECRAKPCFQPRTTREAQRRGPTARPDILASNHVRVGPGCSSPPLPVLLRVCDGANTRRR